MIVYCKVRDCKHNDKGKCANRWPIGTEAISIEDAIMGPMCSDYEESEEGNQ